MVLHQCQLFSGAAQQLYSLMSNSLETSQLGTFIVVSRHNLHLGLQILQSGREPHTAMCALLPVAKIQQPWTYGCWYEYLKILGTILDCLEDAMLEDIEEFKTCKEYWDEWGLSY